MSEPISKLPILVGPTGVGKSEIAFLLAKKLKAEILSVDAFQVYKGLEIGTAQPPIEWQREVPHHLVGTRDPRQSLNAVEFAREAVQIVQKACEKSKPLVLVGGSGFYIRALVEGPPPGRAPRPEIRAWVLDRARELGVDKTYEWLKTLNPDAAIRLHPNDRKRVCRALELTFEPGTEEMGYKPLGSSSVLFLGLERSRVKLDGLLKERTHFMWKNGLLAETDRLLGMGLPSNHPLWGAIGYTEAMAYRKGEMDEVTAQERIFRRTRQYAKRQWTWFKHQHDVRWFDLDTYGDSSQVVEVLKKLIHY